MSTAKKRQEEKNLKILREVLAYEGNKYCFDCNQRGPTYVNMTIGSFVCTNCGGALRKYSHRVKSISMSNFNQNEMDFIKKRGNDICKRIYYGLCDNKMPPEFDTKNGMLDSHLRSKYELKKWFVEPTTELEEEAIRLNQALFDRADKSNSSTNKSVGNKMISVNAASSMIIEPPRSNNSRINAARTSVDLQKSNPPISTNGNIDPSKLGGGSVVKLPMPSSSNSTSTSNLNTTKPSKSGSLIETNDLFADFNSSTNSIQSSFQMDPPTNNVPSSKSINFNMEPLAPIAASNAAANSKPNFPQNSAHQQQHIDKYAALAELDDLFSQSTQITPSNNTQQQTVFSGNQGYWGAGAGFYTNNTSAPANPISQHNPFTLPQQQHQPQPIPSQNMNNPFTNPSTTPMAPNWSNYSTNQQPNVNSSTNDFNPFGSSSMFGEPTQKPANPNPFL